MNKASPIIISGAGLSGLTAGINLLRAGYSVKIFEIKPFIGQQKIETVQLLPNWFNLKDVVEELEGCGIQINWKTKIKEIDIYFSLSKKITIKGSEKIPIGYTVLRGGKNSFEKFLADQFQQLGGKIIFAKSPPQKPKIIATGKSRPITIGYGRVYRGDFLPTKAIVFLDPLSSPSLGYGYFFPHHQSRATIKISQKIGEKIALKQNLLKIKEKYLKDVLLEKNFEGEFFTQRSFFLPQTAMKHNSFFVGEAAGFQDELFRFGMRYAVISGYLCAQAIIKNQSYDYLWKRYFLKEMKKTRKVKKAFLFLKRKNFKNLGRFSGTVMNFERFKKLWNSPLPNLSPAGALLFYLFPFLFSPFKKIISD